MPDATLSVLVDQNHLNRFTEIVENCKRSGLNVDQQLNEIGVITGSIDSARIDALRQLEGVSHVEASRDIKIAPPGSDIQ